MFGRIADLAERRPRRIIALTIAVALAGGVYGGPVAGLLSSGGKDFRLSSAESGVARDRLEDATGDAERLLRTEVVKALRSCSI